jgi:hypothetical protein
MLGYARSYFLVSLLLLLYSWSFSSFRFSMAMAALRCAAVPSRLFLCQDWGNLLCVRNREKKGLIIRRKTRWCMYTHTHTHTDSGPSVEWKPIVRCLNNKREKRPNNRLDAAAANRRHCCASQSHRQQEYRLFVQQQQQQSIFMAITQAHRHIIIYKDSIPSSIVFGWMARSSVHINTAYIQRIIHVCVCMLVRSLVRSDMYSIWRLLQCLFVCLFANVVRIRRQTSKMREI